MDSQGIKALFSTVEERATKQKYDDRVFKYTYQVERILHRDKEISELVSYVGRALVKGETTSILVSGAPGTGKTTTVAKVLKPESLPWEVAVVNINCAETTTQIRLLQKILNELGSDSDGTIGLVDRLRRAVKGRRVIIIFDEIDFLFQGKHRQEVNTGFFYNLLRDNLAKVVIGIANDTGFARTLDPRARDTLAKREINFPAYTRSELADILYDRFSRGGLDGAVTRDIVDYAVGKLLLGGDESGGIRIILEVFKEAAGKHSEASPIKQDMIDEVFKSLRESHVKQTIQRLPPHQASFLYACITAYESRPTSKSRETGEKKYTRELADFEDVYEEYESVCSDYSLEAMDVEKVYGMATYLRQMQFIALQRDLQQQGVIKRIGVLNPQLLGMKDLILTSLRGLVGGSGQTVMESEQETIPGKEDDDAAVEQLKRFEKSMGLPLCACGCGRQVRAKHNKYLHGHSGGRQPKYSNDPRKKSVERSYQVVSDEEMKARIKADYTAYGVPRSLRELSHRVGCRKKDNARIKGLLLELKLPLPGTLSEGGAKPQVEERRYHLSMEEKERVKELLLKGRTRPEIADSTGKSIETIGQLAKKYGVVPRPQLNGAHASPTRGVLKWGGLLGDRVIDLGCGHFHNMEALRKTGRMVVGIDIDGKIAREAAEKKDVIFIRADAACLPFKDGVFTGAVASYTVMFLKNRERFYQEVARVGGADLKLIWEYYPCSRGDEYTGAPCTIEVETSELERQGYRAVDWIRKTTKHGLFNRSRRTTDGKTPQQLVTPTATTAAAAPTTIADVKPHIDFDSLTIREKARVIDDAVKGREQVYSKMLQERLERLGYQAVASKITRFIHTFQVLDVNEDTGAPPGVAYHKKLYSKNNHPFSYIEELHSRIGSAVKQGIKNRDEILKKNNITRNPLLFQLIREVIAEQEYLIEVLAISDNQNVDDTRDYLEDLKLAAGAEAGALPEVPSSAMICEWIKNKDKSLANMSKQEKEAYVERKREWDEVEEEIRGEEPSTPATKSSAEKTTIRADASLERTLRDYYATHPRPSSIREIVKAIGRKSNSSYPQIKQTLKQLGLSIPVGRPGPKVIVSTGPLVCVKCSHDEFIKGGTLKYREGETGQRYVCGKCGAKITTRGKVTVKTRQRTTWEERAHKYIEENRKRIEESITVSTAFLELGGSAVQYTRFKKLLAERGIVPSRKNNKTGDKETTEKKQYPEGPGDVENRIRGHLEQHPEDVAQTPYKILKAIGLHKTGHRERLCLKLKKEFTKPAAALPSTGPQATVKKEEKGETTTRRRCLVCGKTYTGMKGQTTCPDCNDKPPKKPTFLEPAGAAAIALEENNKTKTPSESPRLELEDPEKLAEEAGKGKEKAATAAKSPLTTSYLPESAAKEETGYSFPGMRMMGDMVACQSKKRWVRYDGECTSCPNRLLLLKEKNLVVCDAK